MCCGNLTVRSVCLKVHAEYFGDPTQVHRFIGSCEMPCHHHPRQSSDRAQLGWPEKKSECRRECIPSIVEYEAGFRGVTIAASKPILPQMTTVALRKRTGEKSSASKNSHSRPNRGERAEKTISRRMGCKSYSYHLSSRRNSSSSRSCWTTVDKKEHQQRLACTIDKGT